MSGLGARGLWKKASGLFSVLKISYDKQVCICESGANVRRFSYFSRLCQYVDSDHGALSLRAILSPSPARLIGQQVPPSP